MKNFALKHYRWILFVLSILVFIIFHGFLKGAATVGFLWTGFVCYNFYLKEKRYEFKCR
jgi:hypothetical protein